MADPHRFLKFLIACGIMLLWQNTQSSGQSVQDCLLCHEDIELTDEAGKSVHVPAQRFSASVHADLSCIDCHDQTADWNDIPHFSTYRKVTCVSCHPEATQSFKSSFHGIALAKASADAPNCASCHGEDGNPHAIQSLDVRSSENACRRCHVLETKLYNSSVHFKSSAVEKGSPGCVSCHKTHTSAPPPSTGAVNNLCENCHPGAMEQVKAGDHRDAEMVLGEVMSCASCHDIHAVKKPHLDQGTLEACIKCHPDNNNQFTGSVHDEILAAGEMSCISCHRTHQLIDAPDIEEFGCGSCHGEIEEDYRNSAHRLARLKGDEAAATCADCHNGHHILHPADPESQVNRMNIPQLCGICHGDTVVITSDFVRLPISLPNYTTSVHGRDSTANHSTAVCTDCHGVHMLQSASNPSSSINKQNLASTCGQCHEDVSHEYAKSIHGRAVALGIMDSPSCTDCHDEHLILPVEDPHAAVNPANQASATCGKCHEDQEMAARYGIPLGAVESYLDSYHGWAIKRGGKAVATCVDCHNMHDIRSTIDPTSSIHINNVVETCGRCHENSNAEFAASYTHLLARDHMMVHDWVRVVYIWMIAIVLGGMAMHNMIIFGRALLDHYRSHKSKPAVRRLTQSEIVQHILLMVTFFSLALTGFALRYPNAWWAEILTNIGLVEEVRRLVHRVFAVLLVAASLYHMWYMVLTQRGRTLTKAVFPKFRDLRDALANINHTLNPRSEGPKFGMFDYTQKAEYWALIWGTALMSVTGLVLWFPTLATSWLPAWIVRVCEVVHFYEAILAVSAIFIWHFFYEIFLPRDYPMNWSWITGRMSEEEWKEAHAQEVEETGQTPEKVK